MTDITLTQGSTVVTVQGTKADWDLSKDWKITKIPTTAGSWAETTLNSAVTSGDGSIVVTDATNFRVGDKITITGTDGSGVVHADSQTITAVSAATGVSTFTLNSTMGADYITAGSKVVKEGRIISLDFNKIVETLTIQGYLIASATRTVIEVVQDLQSMSRGGGSINVNYGPYYFPEMAVTKINISEQIEDQGSGTNPTQYGVILNMTWSGKYIGE